MTRSLFSIVGGIITGCFVISLCWANPAMLPPHPGYQMDAAKDPVTGMPLTNDPGQAPLSSDRSLAEAAQYHDREIMQSPEGYPSLESTGAGLLPKTKGYPEYKIDPPVKSAIVPKP